MKYPRTYHFPFSPGATNDDKVLQNIDHLLNVPLIITEKMDGSNVCLSKEGCFARSHNGPPTHRSFGRYKALHASIKHLIPNNLSLYGEWCFAKHSIYYDKLPAFFLLFGIKDTNGWGSWSGVEYWAKNLGLVTVPVIHHNITFETVGSLESFITGEATKVSECGVTREGVVVRFRMGLPPDADFSQFIVKWVRKDHVQTSDHWKHQEIVRNQLRNEAC